LKEDYIRIRDFAQLVDCQVDMLGETDVVGHYFDAALEAG
jgi:hypothetical protein